MERDPRRAQGTVQREPGQELGVRDTGLPIDRVKIGVRGQPETEQPASARDTAPIIGVWIIGVDHRHVGGRQVRDGLAFAPRDSVQIPEELEMLGAGVRDQSYGGAHETHEVGDVSDAVGTELDDRGCGSGLQAQQGQRNADVVIEVAPCRERLAAAREDRRRHFLGRGLAVGPCDGDDRCGELPPPDARERLECRERVLDQDLRQGIRVEMIDDRPGGAGGGGRADELIGIEIRPV
jgi:hypothetical protein